MEKQSEPYIVAAGKPGMEAHGFSLYVSRQYYSNQSLRDAFIDLIATYRIAGKFGGELNLAVWRSILQPPN